MTIFAYNLCLQFVVAGKDTQYQFQTISFAELMSFFFKGLEHEQQQFYVAADATDAFVQDVFELQGNDVWRDIETTVAIVFAHEKNREDFLKKFLARFKEREAAGGIVTNAAGEYLFIQSRRRWSFPKGGIEWQEKPEKAAIREVQEETGLQEVAISQKATPTYHTFNRKDGWMMKVTHWYRMTTTSTQILVPQQEEGITAVRWISKSEWINGTWDTYPLVRHLIEQEFVQEIIAK